MAADRVIDAPDPGDAAPPLPSRAAALPAYVPHPQVTEGRAGGAPATLLLSLFLVVLAFFMALVGMSTRDDDRSAAVLRSVAETFPKTWPKGDDPRPPAATAGHALAGAPLADGLEHLFATELDVTDIRTTRTGPLLSITVPAAAVFRNNAAHLTAAARALLDDIVIVVGDRPAGVGVAIDATVFRDGSTESVSVRASRRAATLGAAFAGRGIAPATLTVGVGPAAGDHVRFDFVIGPPRGQQASAALEARS